MCDITETGDSILPGLRCISCKNFLSIAPILIDKWGNNICGRCKSGADELHVRNVFYERLAHQYLFPCKFISEGCDRKVGFGEMQLHEVTCPYRIIKCEVTNCVWFGIVTELIIHYKDHHQELILENDSLQKITEEDGCFMITHNGHCFLVEWSYYDHTFGVKIKRLNVVDSDCDIIFNYTVCKNSSKEPIKLTSSLKSSQYLTTSICDLFIDGSLLESPILFSINAELPINIVNEKKIICPNCSLQMVPPILKCPFGHITCVDCCDSRYDYCVICEEDEIRFTRVQDLEYIAVSSLYTCRWKCCESNFSFRQIQAHQLGCPKRIYKCLHCPRWHGLREEILPHNLICKGKDGLDWPMAIDTQVTFMGTAIDEADHTLLAYNEIFWAMSGNVNGNTEVAICNNGLASQYGWYRYEVELQHVEDSNCPFNKTYSITNKCNGHYFLEIPSRDIAKFGGREFFRVIVKVILLEGNERTLNTTKHLRSIL